MQPSALTHQEYLDVLACIHELHACRSFKLSLKKRTLVASLTAEATITVGDFCVDVEFASAGRSCVLKSKGKSLACKASPPR